MKPHTIRTTINKTNKQLIAIAFGVSTLFGNIPIALAQTEGGIRNPVIGNLGNDPEAAKDGSLFLKYFVTLWRAFISMGAILVLLYLVWGAVDWISAGGDSGKLEKARQKMTQAVLGIIVLVSSFTLVAFLGNLLFEGEFNLLRLTIPSALLESQQ